MQIHHLLLFIFNSDMTKNIRRSATLKERLFFRRRIDPITDCWIWTGATTTGYGQITYQGKRCLVHRLSYAEFVKIPTQLVLHKNSCHNRKCFNPDHLYEGKQVDNISDSIAIGTHYPWKLNNG